MTAGRQGLSLSVFYMAEPNKWQDEDYVNEAKRIVREYLSGLVRIKAHRNMAVREVRPAVQNAEVEEKFRQLNQQEEDIEWKFGQETDKWRNSPDKGAKIVIGEIVKALGKRNDLGFFGKRIVERLKRNMDLR